MGIDWLSGSQAPNALAVLCAVTLSTIMFFNRKRHPRLYRVIIGMGAMLVLAVIAKNVAYYAIVSQSNSENSVSSLHSYANTLTVIAGVQLLLGVGFLASSPVPKAVDWIANTTAAACLYATVCTLDWRNVYLSQDPSLPVNYVAFTPILHWLFIAILLGFFATTVWHGIKYKKNLQ